MAVIGINDEIIGVSGCHGMVNGLCGFRAVKKDYGSVSMLLLR